MSCSEEEEAHPQLLGCCKEQDCKLCRGACNDIFQFGVMGGIGEWRKRKLHCLRVEYHLEPARLLWAPELCAYAARSVVGEVCCVRQDMRGRLSYMLLFHMPTARSLCRLAS